MVPSATSSAITIVRLRRVAQVEIRISDPSQILWFWMGGDTRFTRPPTPRFLSPLAPPARICLHGSRRTRNDQRPEPARVTGCHIRHHSRHDRRLQPRSDYGGGSCWHQFRLDVVCQRESRQLLPGRMTIRLGIVHRRRFGCRPTRRAQCGRFHELGAEPGRRGVHSKLVYDRRWMTPSLCHAERRAGASC